MENNTSVQAQDTDADIMGYNEVKGNLFFNQMLRGKEEMQNEFYGGI